MRTKLDRVRHAIFFEIIGMAIFVPLFSLILGQPVASMGVIGIMSATLAMVWNYLYSLGFDKVMQRRVGHTRKSLPIRIIHAILFEGGLVFILVPPIAWYLQVSLLDAFLMDIGFVVFFLIHAFCYNLAYDRIFPVSERQVA